MKACYLELNTCMSIQDMFSYGNYGILRDMLRDIDCGVALRFKMLLKVMKK